MTPTPARRPLDAGSAERPLRAQESDLIDLPDIDFPDPEDLRARGVLAPPTAPAPQARRTLGIGGRAAPAPGGGSGDDDQDHEDACGNTA
ncbi:hypothetical protein [Streptomyces laurentii]|uniref:hypothetical protein n=1 Tax=Streptomyces laurentii TaxID=39478 RepID=UPI003682CE08